MLLGVSNQRISQIERQAADHAKRSERAVGRGEGFAGAQSPKRT
jgi:hypothetical protein